MTRQTGLDLATAFLDAWTGRDFDKAGELLADDFAFDGPIARYRSAQDFLAGSAAFVARILPTWEKVAAFGDDRQALLLYDLFLASGGSMRVADHYTVNGGKIRTETILWDTHGFR